MPRIISSGQPGGLVIDDGSVGDGRFFVMQSAYILSDTLSFSDSIRINTTISNVAIQIAGTLIASDDGVQVNGNDRVVLTSTGSIFSSFGVYTVDGGGNVFVVDGLIDASGYGMLLVTDGNVATIGGHVRGGDGISDSGDNTIRITAGGTLEGSMYAYSMAGAGSQSTLVNHGTIIGGFGGALYAFGDHALAFNNTGVTEGDILLGDGADTILNTGVIDGDVSLGGGADIFRTFGAGIVTGQVSGGAGNDVFRGAELSDRIQGDDDNDTFFGGAGNDFLYGGNGNDRFVGDADGVADLYNGGLGNDTIDFSAVTSAVSVNLTAGWASGSAIGADTLVSIERVFGGTGNDAITGSASSDYLSGGSGNDTLRGMGGNDTIIGGDGDDQLYGVTGFDTFVFANGFGKDTIADFDEFSAFEKIDLSAVTNIASFADLTSNHLAQVGANAIITDGVNTITILGANIGDLDAGDFIF